MKIVAIRKAAILGAGYIAEFHIRAIKAVRGVELVAICDHNRARAERLQKQFTIAQAYDSLDEMLATCDLNVIHILLPPPLHAAAAFKCLEKGRDIFVEKPFSCSIAEALQIRAAGQCFGRAIGVNHNNRFHPAFQCLVNAVRDWKLGELEHLTVCLNVPLRQLSAGQHSHWMFNSPGNIVLEQAPHPLSQIIHLLGPVKQASVLVSGKTTLNSGVDFYDTWQCSLLCERGTAQLFMGFGRDYLDSWINGIGQDAAGRCDLRRNTFQITRKTRFLEPLDNLLNGLEIAVKMAADSVARFIGYALGFIKLRSASDPFSISMHHSVAQFYEDLATEQTPREGIDQAVAVIAACDAIIKGYSEHQAVGSQLSQVHEHG